MKLLLGIFLILSAPHAWGRWVGVGGGELFKDVHNPFFLKNVTQVNYCVSVASRSFSISPEKARATVAEAIAYWKNEFRKIAAGAGAGQFTLGTQEFTEVDCARTDVHLQFLLGYESLNTAQRDFLVEPTKYIGITVRTDYNADLKGKGFIYVASDFGPHSYHAGIDTSLVTRAWEHPNLLKYVLLHELGHVFGLPHTGSGLMAETFLEQALSVALAEAFEKAPIEPFFSPDDELDFCDPLQVSSTARAWFGMPREHECLHISRSKAAAFHWQIYSRKDLATALPGTPLGKIMTSGTVLSDYRPRPAIVLQLMGNTKIFSPAETLFRTFMFGPSFLEMTMKANFVPLTGAAKPSLIRQTPDTLSIQAVINGKIETIVSHFSLIGILLMRDPTPIPPK